MTLRKYLHLSNPGSPNSALNVSLEEREKLGVNEIKFLFI